MDPTENEVPLDVDSAVASIADSLNLVEEEPEAAPPEPAETQPAAEAVPPEAPVAEVAPPAEPAPAQVEPAPKSWRKESAEAWATLPPLIREEVAKREQDIMSYVEQTKTPVAIGQQFEKIVGPYMEMFAQSGINVFENYAATLQVQKILTKGSPADKIEVLRTLAQSAGLQLDGTELSAPPQAEQQYVAALEARLAKLEGGVQKVVSTVDEARGQELAQSILKFAQDPAHPYFNELSDNITSIIEKGWAPNLEEAYKLAVQMSPIHQQKIIEVETDKRLAERVAEESARADKARKAAGANVRSSGSRRTEAAVVDVDSTLKDALASIRARET